MRRWRVFSSSVVRLSLLWVLPSGHASERPVTPGLPAAEWLTTLSGWERAVRFAEEGPRERTEVVQAISDKLKKPLETDRRGGGAPFRFEGMVRAMMSMQTRGFAGEAPAERARRRAQWRGLIRDAADGVEAGRLSVRLAGLIESVAADGPFWPAGFSDTRQLGQPGAWQLPEGVFPHEVAAFGDVVYIGSTDGLWELRTVKPGDPTREGDADDMKTRLQRAAGIRVTSPVTVGTDRLMVLTEEGRAMELNWLTATWRPWESLRGRSLGVISQRHGFYFADDADGTWWSLEGDIWQGPIREAQHSGLIDRLDNEWWALTNPDPNAPDKFVLSRSKDLRTWAKAAEFTGNQPGLLAAGAGVIVITETAGVRVFDLRELSRTALVAVGPADERPSVYFAHGYFWLLGERDGLWRSADGLGWQNLRPMLTDLEAPLAQLGFAPGAIVLAGYTGKIICVPVPEIQTRLERAWEAEGIKP